MSKIGQSLLKGAEEALAYAKGNKKVAREHTVQVPRHIDVRAIRDKLKLTRSGFSAKFGFNIRTLEKWEQGIREPEGPARAYLLVIARNHKAVEKALLQK
jgi:putative transcriptional regulator